MPESSDSPFELANDFASLFDAVSAPIVSEAAVRSRVRSAVVVVLITLTATAAPIATSPPAAAASEVRARVEILARLRSSRRPSR